jgi:hypothetical protein
MESIVATHASDTDAPMKTEYQYISFIKQPTTGKTQRWSCQNRGSGVELGQVKWYGAWRQYCYFPTLVAIYSAGCLIDIKDFITQLKSSRV